ncbi:MAG: hypothetical protein Q8807_02365, partial ['Waltheria sp.' little leaf phytoplasma]|nr:hypothetical protein ['Waltheria sp.' little leaf phytoplasma]
TQSENDQLDTPSKNDDKTEPEKLEHDDQPDTSKNDDKTEPKNNIIIDMQSKESENNNVRKKKRG